MSLLDDVTEQLEDKNVAYDIDGIIYLSCYRFKDTEDTELMYADFWMRIKSIEVELWKSYAIDKTILAMTSKKNFRHGLTDKWKADRKAKPESEMTEKQLEAHKEAQKLRNHVSKVKVLLNKRMARSEAYRVLVNNIAEADDTVIDLAHQGWLIVSMDSDIIKQSPEPVFNYHKKHWKWTEGNSYESIFFHIIHDTITGGHNGKFGVTGKGKVFANNFIAEMIDGSKSIVDWSDLFETPEEAVLNFQVTDCNQVKNGKLYLHTMESILDYCEEVVGEVF